MRSATDLASVGSSAAASSPKSAASSASSPAWRARIGTTSRPASSQSIGNELVTDPVAQVRRVVVAGVLDRAESQLGTKSVGLGPAQPEDRVPRPGSHGRKPVGGGAAEKVEQHGLGLVIGCVTGGGTRWQDPSRAARARASRFGPGAT